MLKALNLNSEAIIKNSNMITQDALKDIFKPKISRWRTSITQVEPNRLITRGYSQEDLIGNISFPAMINLLLKGRLPTKKEEKMLSAVLVSFCDHGVTPPSTQSARLMASAGSSINACIAGGILAFGENHAGAIEKSMKMLQEGVEIAQTYSRPLNKVAKEIFFEYLNNGLKIPGFGHRYHNEDPRAPRLLELAKNYGYYGDHSKLIVSLEKLLEDEKRIKMNVDGVNAAVLSDLGFDWRIGCGMFIIGRIPGILAHVCEEKTKEKPFRKIFDPEDIYQPPAQINFL
ncbi:MAG TPA: citryl-CoA lyase [Methanobacteriaceae archaeon]|nr:citryl-CoA lyase [Methanobacteriaceae archaeon]